MDTIPLFSTIVTFAFTVAVFQRYLVRRGPHLLMWSIGLLLYGLGTLSEVVLSLQFSEIMLKIWYLSGAMLTAAWLGQGTIHLLVRRGRTAWILTAGLGLVSLAALALVFGAPLNPTAAANYQVAQAVSVQYRDILQRNAIVTALTIILNIYGTVGMVGGALYSAYLFWRKQVMLNRVLGNVLIAAGALAPAMAGSFVKAGLVDVLYVSELIGAVLMFTGFWLSTSKAAVAATSASPQTVH
jgi:hypothetical protein